jgi:hypothetical protein
MHLKSPQEKAFFFGPVVDLPKPLPPSPLLTCSLPPKKKQLQVCLGAKYEQEFKLFVPL